ncbi:uncharacterized protein DS421_5g145350 [Arachis hypogaea]|nr:uncharacterized protein DS421_5g145350 [Arachis hypogaea]
MKHSNGALDLASLSFGSSMLRQRRSSLSASPLSISYDFSRYFSLSASFERTQGRRRRE